MRVIAGTARSLPLKCPPGTDIRPTTDKIKETLFNILQADIPGCVFLDLFSGSGAIGIEAISRGAKKAYFVENAAPAIACIQNNLQFTKFTEKAVLLKQDVSSALGSIREKEVDLIFMDPPYDKELEKQALAVLKDCTYVTADTKIIIEASRQTDFSYVDELGFSVYKEKYYKTNQHIFLQRKEAV